MLTLSEIAAALGTTALGDATLRIARAAEPGLAGPDDLALAMSPAYATALAGTKARSAVVWDGADWQALGLQGAIIVPRARLAMARLTELLSDTERMEPGIHPSAVVHSSARIGQGVAIGPLCVIGAEAVIGDEAQLLGQCSIGMRSVIGADALIHPGVRIGAGVSIGARVVLQPGVVIGADGFSFVTETASQVEVARASLGAGALTVPDDPTWHKIHSLGSVVIGDDVEIGANSTVDAGTIRATRIGSGTKIDNLVQVGHNVVVGTHCLLCAQAAVAGSAVLGDRVVLGGKSGVADNIRLGDDVVAAGGAILLSNVPAGRVMMGYPATRMDLHVESYKALRRLPRFMRDIASRLQNGQNSVPKRDESD